jgi:hypothetical protein
MRKVPAIDLFGIGVRVAAYAQVESPEIDPASVGTAPWLAGTLLVVRGRRRR